MAKELRRIARRRALLGAVVAGALSSSGCAVHYFDAATGSEHLWGFGHMVMKSAPSTSPRQAVIRGTDVLGMGVGIGDPGHSLSIGWDSRRTVDIIDDDTRVDLRWPHSDFLSLRVGPPPVPNAAAR